MGPVALNAPTVSLAGDGGPQGSLRRCDVVVLGIPDQTSIPSVWREVLILAEQRSVPTVLLVETAEQLGHPLASVVTHLVTTDDHLLPEVAAFAGAERSALLDQLGSGREQTTALLALTGKHTPVEKS